MVIQHEDIKRFKERDEEMMKLEATDTIQPNNLFHTPTNIAELQAKLMNYNGSERAAAMMGAMMAWNLACSLVNKK